MAYMVFVCIHSDLGQKVNVFLTSLMSTAYIPLKIPWCCKMKGVSCYNIPSERRLKLFC